MEDFLRIKSATLFSIQDVLMQMDKEINASTEKLKQSMAADPGEALSKLTIPVPNLKIQGRLARIDRALEHIRTEVIHALEE